MSRDLVTRAAELARNLAAWSVVRLQGSRISMTRTKQNEADVVTDIDLSIEMWVRSTIEIAFPDHGFVGEEFGTKPGAEYTWYCDPIDGTTNFATGLGWYSFSLALADEDGPVLGVLADPRTGEVFSAVRGRGAQLNGHDLRIEPRRGLAGAVLMTELLGAEAWPGMGRFIDRMAREYVTTRILGSSALSVTGLAAGRGQAAILHSFGAVDSLASLIIADEAGLDVLDVTGTRNLFPRAGGILVANPGMSERLFDIWSEHS